MSKPVRVRVRMYQVGFGDCFLISVEYDKPLPDKRSVRHLLIDYGSTRSAQKGREPGRMREVAALLEKHTDGVLDVVALTHRHKDHLFGFADDTGAATLRRLGPQLVLRPWTEEPSLQPDATGPASALAGPSSVAFAAALAGAQVSAQRLAARPGLHEDVLAAVADQVKNPDAIKLLDDLAEAGEGRYLYAGADAGVTEHVPGLTVTVLGPPTVEQDPRVAKQREDDPDEYWMLRLQASLDAAAGAPENPVECDVDLGPGPVRWLVERLGDQRDHSAARLVRNLDDALNNTSLVLLLEIGGLTLLFPGDAQIENWQYTLEKLGDEPDLRAKLRDLDLYKVGHHGSRNATPKSLYALWQERPSALPPMTVLMSTRPGVHGESDATRVPRKTLVDALGTIGTLYSTDDLVNGETYLEVVADVTGGPFTQVAFSPG